MKVVSNTGPIIGLAKIGKTDLLRDMFGKIMIPPMVKRELLGKTGPESTEIDHVLAAISVISDLPEIAPATAECIENLDEGEKEAIALASGFASDDVLLIMDDKAGREAAKKLNIPITGLVELLLRAKETKRISSVMGALNDLRRQGYWLSDEVIRVAKEFAGEQER